MEKKKSYTVSLAPETMRLVDQAAAEAGVSRSGLIDMTLRAALCNSMTTRMFSMLADLTRVQEARGVPADDTDPLTPDDLTRHQADEPSSSLASSPSENLLVL